MMSLGAPLQAASLSSRGAVRGANFARLTSGARATSASMSTRRTTVMRTTHRFVEDAESGQLVDYYALLGVKQDATRAEIKAAYYDLARVCHPDVAGNPGNNLCVLLNEAYSTLKDENLREYYDYELELCAEDVKDGFTGKTRSRWCGPEDETRAVFVDENTCIGCKQCIWAAPATFRLEMEHGRSQVFGQWLNNFDQIQTAIEACPVQCIHWVKREDLPILEHVMAKIPRVNVGLMMQGAGGAVEDVFQSANTYKKRRAEAAAARLKARKNRVDQSARGKASNEVSLGSVFATFAAATGWAWNPKILRERGATIPVNRALVPIAAYQQQRRAR